MGSGEKVFPLSYDQTARERHPAMMGYVLPFLLFEIPDGLTLLAAADEPLLQSTHASTAVLGLPLMGAVALLGTLMGSSKSGRDAHAYMGTAVPPDYIVSSYALL